MNKLFHQITSFIKREAMMTVAIAAALISLLITPPSAETLNGVDWKTLATLFMLLLILDGFKSENLFLPVLRRAGRMRTQTALSFFLVFGVFFSSMFVTNDVSLIVFVPLTIILFRAGSKEHYILPIIALENVAAVRGSLLTPFGSPQNLFLFSQSGISAGDFLLMMLPLWIGSMILISVFILFIYRKDIKEPAMIAEKHFEEWSDDRRSVRLIYVILFAAAIVMIVSRTKLWPYIVLVAVITLLIADRKVFKRVDYALIITFFCFFLFSSSVAANEGIAAFLRSSVAGHEYIWSLGLSQIISNVPASIVLWPFTDNLKPLIYGLDTAGLVSVIGSLASVINMRIYTREYPGKGGQFLLWFEKISLAFFAIVAPLQLLLI